MKRTLTILFACLISITSFAQSDKNFFNHLSVGLNLGTPGFGLDVAMPANDHLQLRAGFATLTGSSATDVDVIGNYPTAIKRLFGEIGIPHEFEVDTKVNLTNVKVLVDIFPFKRSSFHFTTGIYFGSKKVLRVDVAESKAHVDNIVQANNNIEQFNQMTSMDYDKMGVAVGDYLLVPDQNGFLDATINAHKWKPYLGIGIGRSVPKNKRWGFMAELGSLFWRSPRVYCNGERLEKMGISQDADNILDFISSISAYPVLNFRLTFKAF